MFYFMLILVLFQISCVSSERKLRIPPMTKYLIENDVCYVPYFDPWSLQSNYKNQSGFINFCPEIEPLVYFERTNLKINVYIKDFLLENSMELECCLSNITRNMSKSIPDNSFSESSCEVFENSTEIKNDVIRTICYKNDTKKKLYEDIHGFFIDTNLNRTDEEVSSPLIGYNVLIILVDSLSQNNFLRHLQNTHRFLINSGYVNLNIFNQVGKDNFQNILPLLTGFSHRFARMKFGNPSKKFFDDYPFVWNDFEKNGYVTAFAQDYSEKHFFNEKCLGFFEQPTTYYFRSYIMSSNRLNTTYLNNMPNCTASFSASERILNLILEFVKTFLKRNYFGTFCLSSFTKYDFNAPGRMDEILLEFFKMLQNLLEDTFIFFLGTNGYFNDNVSKNIYGWFESRTPFAYVYVPVVFRTIYPEQYNSLLSNREKLISPYDIYVTLQDILEKSRNGYISKPARSCRNCNSIFREHSHYRTCKEAGIDKYWCTCLNKKFEQFQNGNESNTYYVDL
ncbi:uncharacterized protein [Onthophagus taurus]|uniref:uncharacterized protein n=1 Tax=Onthophagus taurus TaxID=166361 RepID=UPI000C20586D|nr:uncharacterized protein LOC111413980 [Onthophagus taurus]